jgi:tripartite ATP-independent transporter DctM subunit
VPAEAFILVFSFLALLALNVPIAFALGISTALALWALAEVPASYIVAQRMAGGIDSFPLLAIPFFILAGVLMGEGGMARRMMDFASALVGPFRSGLAYVNTLTCMMFGAVSGSATAAVSSIGGFMIPEMNAKGYPREFNVALTTASATTGLVIPPSNIMIVYAVVAQNVSIADMFLAGVFPGILIGLLIMLTCLLLSYFHGYGASIATSREKIVATGLRALPSLGLIVIILGGILGGIFTATEASAVAVAYALLLTSAIYREVRLRDLPQILLAAGKTTSIVMLLIGASQAMGWFLAYEQIPQAVSQGLLDLSDRPVVILLAINCLLLAVGTFMDMTPAILIFTPIFLPPAVALGMDPVHFGIVMIVNLCIGLCTPPVGTCLFLGCSVGRTTLARVTRAMIPFYIAMLAALALVTYVPWLTLALPRAFGR